MEGLKRKFNRKAVFFEGFKAGIPIALGYFAVSFSLGITARNAGVTPIQSLIISLLCNASAGEYAGFTVISAAATYIEMALMIFIANARYFLMSCALSQKLSPGLKLCHKLLIGFDLTDELFAISVAREGYLNPFYFYGAAAVSIPAWAVGTALGTVTGNIIPETLVNALSVALYGMFLVVIIPPAKKNRIIALLIAVSFALSYLFNRLSLFSAISSGTKIIILTIIISALAALLFPVKDEEVSK